MLPKSGKDYVFVGLQLLLFAAYILPITMFPIKLPDWLRYLGCVVMVLGAILGIVALFQINTNLSPFPTPVDKGKLITTGAFRISRHPIYMAIMVAGIGYAIFQTSVFKGLVVVFLLILFYFKSLYEERLLMDKFSAYKVYKKKTRRFI
jgi:protein-S-isoprenylcysteine O-methyltransferase Ste14